MNGFVFEIYPISSNDSPTTNVRIGFAVDDVDSVIPSLSEIGAEVIVASYDSEWGRRAVVKDLGGHTVELLTPHQRTL